jgi:hypothetical protein
VIIFEIVCVVLQFVLFLPFYLIWRKDCREIGKENLAVSLGERFEVWLICCPLRALPIVDLIKKSRRCIDGRRKRKKYIGERV